MTKIVNAWNEWDPLKRVILGRPEGTHIAAPEPGLYSHQPNSGYPLGTYGPYPQEMVDEANEQMDHFEKIMIDRGIIVDRVDGIRSAWMDVAMERLTGRCPISAVRPPRAIFSCQLAMRS